MEHDRILEVRASLESLTSTFATVPWAVALMTLDGRFLEANPSYCRMVGYSMAELRQIDLLAITQVDDRSESCSQMACALEDSAEAVFLQTHFVSSSGGIIPVQGSLSVIRGSHGQPLHLMGIFKDVSERNAAGETLRRRSALLEIAGRVALVGGWTLDMVNQRVAWCDVVAAIHDQPPGYCPSLAEGLDYYAPQSKKIIRDAIERCTQDGTPYDLELEIITATGRRVWVRAIGLAERDERGRIVRIQGALQDISSLKEKEQAAAELAERLRVTLESITDGFFTLDRDWRFTYVNDQAQSFLGRIDRPLLGQQIWTELSQTFGSDFEDQMRSALDAATPVRFEQFGQVLKNWYLFSVFPSSQGLAVYFRDISDVRADRRRLELLEVCMERLHDMVIITEAVPLNHPGPRIQYVNEAFTRVTGFDRSEAIGNSPRMLQGVLTDRDELDRIRNALAKSEPVHAELLNYTKLGEAFWVEIDIVPVAFDGEPCSHFAAIERDISKRKRAQQALLDEEVRLRFLHDLSASVRTLSGPTQVMVETARRLGDYLGASFAEYREVAASAQNHVAPIDSTSPLGAQVAWPLLRQGTLHATLFLNRGESRTWTSSENALIEEVVSRYWNVAERMNAESELRENLRLLRMAGRTARLGGWAVDLPQMTVHFFDELCDILDVLPGTKATMDEVYSLYTPESRALIMRAFDRCAEQGVSFDLDLELRTVKGRDLFVGCTGEAKIGADGVVTRVYGALQDVTEREKTAVALRSSLEELRTLAEAMPQIVWSTRADGWPVYFNQQWMDYTGLTLEESIGHGWEKAFHPEDLQPVWAAWNQAMQTAGIHSIESRLRRADGEYRWWLIRAAPVLDTDGRILKWLGTNTDIHDLEIARIDVLASHSALQESERRFSELLRTVDLLSVMLDLEGRITYCNDFLLKVTGWQRDELIGRNWYEIFLQDDDAANNERIAKIRGGSVESWVRENPIVLRSGQQRTIRWSNSVLISAEGSVAGTASIGEDITDRLRDQAALSELNTELESRVQARTAQLTHAREEADLANKAKSAFLAAMSHEIRTPMNGVIGMIDVLQQTSLNGPQIEMVGLVQESAISLLSIIEDILDFSKIEAGKLIVSDEPLRLGSVIERSCALLAPMARKRDVRMTLFIDPALPDEVLGDEGRLRQVVTNLVGNAIKFSSGGNVAGRVSIRALRAAPETLGEPLVHSDDVSMDLVISDNGVGMDEATQARLFTPFIQADPSTTRRFGGTGLGLAICDMLVSLMNGKISVRSRLGQGAVFTVRLPLKLSALAPRSSLPVIGMPKGTIRCCIVGSEQPLRNDLAHTLLHSGWSVVNMPDLGAAAMAEPVAGTTLWLVLPDQVESSPEALRQMAPSSSISQTRFVLLGQGGHHRRPRREAKDVWSVDADALSRSTLFEALLLATQSDQTLLAETHQSTASTTATPLALEPVEARNARVLVAEDNEHNRAVIRHQLRLLGLDAEICNNGLEALDRWRGGDFGLLLTDLHMPVMDGYELATVIRSEERQGQRLPIIALSANGQDAGESRWRTSGIDAYVIKPVRLPELRAVIAKLVALTDATSLSSSAAAVPVPLDLTILAEFIGDDPAVIEEVLTAFQRSTDQAIADFELALSSNAMQSISDAAHKLKSAARSVGAQQLGQLCAELEDAAQNRRVDEVQLLASSFRAECRAVLNFLESR